MKLIIEVEVPDKTVEEMQKFVSDEDTRFSGTAEDAIKPRLVNAVDVFVSLYHSDHVDYTVTKAEMSDMNCNHEEYANKKCAVVSCKNYVFNGAITGKSNLDDSPWMRGAF